LCNFYPMKFGNFFCSVGPHLNGSGSNSVDRIKLTPILIPKIGGGILIADNMVFFADENCNVSPQNCNKAREELQ